MPLKWAMAEPTNTSSRPLPFSITNYSPGATRRKITCTCGCMRDMEVTIHGYMVAANPGHFFCKVAYMIIITGQKLL